MAMIWDTIEALNSLRNKLAHKLEPDDIVPLLKRLHASEDGGPTTLDDPKVKNALGITFASVLGYVGGMGDRERHDQAAKASPGP